MKVLETERLILRPFAMDDLDAYYAYARSPHVGPNAGWNPHRSKAESREALKGIIACGESWAITRRQEGCVIGSVGLHRDRLRNMPRVRMLGYVLAEEYWGRGYATEAACRVIRFAFEEAALSMVSIYHFAFNMRSRRVIEKCGFLYDGTLRRATLLPSGRITDDVCYSLTRADYQARLAAMSTHASLVAP